MRKYSDQTRFLVAVDCIVFGFDGNQLKLLLIKRGFDPEKNQWSLMGGFVKPDESIDDAAGHILEKLTGLSGVYLEQLHAFGKPDRDPIERTISVAYFALIDIHQYETQLSTHYHAEWFPIDRIPELIFDHHEMLARAKKQLRYKAAMHPILFELLPERFTIPQLQDLYEAIYGYAFDTRNFSRKVLSTGLLVKQKEKDKLNSKKGAFYYMLDKDKYATNFDAFLKIVPNPDHQLF
ncbi:MAG: NUDIX hydrolase [Mucilaginibacter polytrichastri]|nr:NUDIX hydrolase [Mucilaginibacter polytrichastri]